MRHMTQGKIVRKNLNFEIKLWILYCCPMQQNKNLIEDRLMNRKSFICYRTLTVHKKYDKKLKRTGKVVTIKQERMD